MTVIVEAQPELLAYHFTQSGLQAPAVEYWGKAGDGALRRSAFKEAIAHLGKAIELTLDRRGFTVFRCSRGQHFSLVLDLT